MANTTASAFSAAFQAAVQSQALKNLRDDLIWANPAFAEHGTLGEREDTLMFLQYPDLAITTPLTPLTEGTAPTARVITMTNVIIGTSQYGDLVSLTDVAKIKGTTEVVRVASERVGRAAKEVINQVTRDAVFTGGTAYYTSVDHTTRVTLDTSDIITGLDIIKMRATAMKRNIPLFPDNTYHLYLGAGATFDLQSETTDDSGWLDSQKYDNSGAVLSGEIGKFHGVRIFTNNLCPTFASTVTVSAGLLLGNIRGWGVGDLQSLTAYHNSGNDFANPLAQLENVGWIVMFGAGTLSNSYYLRVEGFATAIS
jgi:N4-gp56 family major capsid protein